MLPIYDGILELTRRTYQDQRNYFTWKLFWGKQQVSFFRTSMLKKKITRDIVKT